MEQVKWIADRLFSVELYRYALLILTLLNTVTVFYYWTTALNPVFLIWGGCILIRDLFTKRNMLKNRGRYFLLGFLLLYMVTIFVAGRNKLYGNLVVFGYTALNLLLLYSYSDQDDRETVLLRLKRFLTILVVFSFLMAVASLVIYFGHIYIAYPSNVDKTTEYMGYVNGRLWGINGNPNPCGIMAVYSITASAMLFCWVKKHRAVKRVLLGGNAVLQLMVMAGVKSRGAEIALVIFLAVASLLIGYLLFLKAGNKLIKSDSKRSDTLKRAACGALAVVLMAGVAGGSYWVLGKNQGMLAALDGKMKSISSRQPSLPKQQQYSVPAPTPPENYDAQRPDLQLPGNDITNGRSKIWKAGFQVLKEYPILGVSFKNVPERVEQVNGAPLTGIEGGGMHNVYLQVAVSNGLAGLICFLGAIAVFIIAVLRYMSRLSKRPSRWYMALLIPFFCMVFAYNMVESRVLYSIAYAPLLFWYFLGVGMFLINKDTGREDKENLLARMVQRITPKRFQQVRATNIENDA